ncbi:uncharacterized protein LOC143028737 [Oratosquilla oratoria]|uniref:uncharacterized protein LOC143028737 n=1 Tax=Oratosquilla oratoria TaxID=337810 RepID=UPI003F76E5EE
MGVPQGSVLAPTLFAPMLSDIGKGLRKDTTITAYADDIAVWRRTRHRCPKKDSAQNKAELSLFQSQVDSVVRHLESIGFLLSPNKTVYIPVHLPGYNRGHYLTWNVLSICGTEVPPSPSVRYMGVIFQKDGRWTSQVQQAINNARRAPNLIKAVRHEP